VLSVLAVAVTAAAIGAPAARALPGIGVTPTAGPPTTLVTVEGGSAPSPSVANGRVYVGGFGGGLRVYGLSGPAG